MTLLPGLFSFAYVPNWISNFIIRISSINSSKGREYMNTLLKKTAKVPPPTAKTRR